MQGPRRSAHRPPFLPRTPIARHTSDSSAAINGQRSIGTIHCGGLHSTPFPRDIYKSPPLLLLLLLPRLCGPLTVWYVVHVMDIGCSFAGHT